MRITLVLFSILFIILPQHFDIIAASDTADANLDSNAPHDSRSLSLEEPEEAGQPYDNMYEAVRNSNGAQDVEEMDGPPSLYQSPPLLFSNNKCDEGLIDLCEDGSTCSGLKHVFLELCYKPDEEMTGCTSDCSFLLAQLEKEATNQGKALKCVYYVQNLPSKCAEETFYDNLQYTESCPSEDAFTSDLNPGEYEMISCDELFPSGVFGTGPTYRYCMVGGVGSIYTTDTCKLEGDDMEVSKYVDNRMTSSFSSRQVDAFNDIKEGAEEANGILVDAAKVLTNAGEAFKTLATVGKYAGKIGVAFQVIAVAFNIANAFIGEGPSEELLYMKEQFRIVNEKLTLLKAQLSDAENRIVLEIYSSQFSVYKAHLDTCTDRLFMFQRDPTEGTREQFKDGCCTSDRSPLNLLNWIENELIDYLDIAAKDSGYHMDVFLKVAQAIVYSTLIASVMDTACVGTYGFSDEDSISENTQPDKVKRVLQSVENAINKLPGDYINLQLRADVVQVVAESSTTEECRDKLFDVIGTKMRRWTHSPKPSAYCYAPVTGWAHHGVSYNYGNEDCGFFNEFRIYDKFSVGIDWTYESNSIDHDFSTYEIEKDIAGANFGSDLNRENFSKLRDVVSDHMEKTYGLAVRNIAYIGWGNSARWRGFQDRSYFMNINFEYRTMYSIIFSTWPKSLPPTESPTLPPTQSPTLPPVPSPSLPSAPSPSLPSALPPTPTPSPTLPPTGGSNCKTATKYLRSIVGSFHHY